MKIGNRLITCDWEVDSYRLPIEEEWNHAAYADIHPASFTYAGSDEVNEVSWYSDNVGRITHPIGEILPKGLGIYDMSANVFEWCWDISGGVSPRDGDNSFGVDY